MKEHRTAVEWADQIKQLATVDFPQAEKIVLVMDNLNTHTIGSLYKRFPAEEARQLREKLEIHYTPNGYSARLVQAFRLSLCMSSGEIVQSVRNSCA